jgi:hypothetical protein
MGALGMETSNGKGPAWSRPTWLVIVLAGFLLIMGSVSYMNVYWTLSINANSNTNKWMLGPLDRSEISEKWLRDEWKRIFSEERKVSAVHHSLIDPLDNVEVDPTRPIMSVSLTDYAIERFHPWGIYNDINIWDLFPPQVACPDITRLGKTGDGGKWICGTNWLKRFVDKEQRMPRKCLIYSFGVSTHISFEMELKKLADCEIHAFDPTVGKLPEVQEWPPSRASQRTNGITFHKLALANASGVSSVFSLEMTLQDIMHSLNHSYIDVVKVDIEGSEWNVFKHLFRNVNKHYRSHRGAHRAAEEATSASLNRSTLTERFTSERSLIPPNPVYADILEKGQLTPWSLPFGQLLIELHYSTVKAADEFFTSMYRSGYLTFSREINLIPTAHGHPPAACEYSFINPNVFFLEEVEQRPTHLQIAPPPLNAEFHKPVKAVIYFLCQKKRMMLLQNALELLYENFWLDYGRNYPVVIFQDDLGPVEQAYLQRSVPLMKLKFVEIELKIPSNLDPKTVPNRTVCDPKRSTIGYRHMCRFHATAVHELLRKNGFGDVEYIMRLDDDSQLTGPIGYDVFQYMKVNHKLYGFLRTIGENVDCVTGLWDLANDFLNRTAQTLQINRTDVYFDKWPENLVIFNNFEISHVSIWQNPVWKAFIREIDESGGIYYWRWGDAPIHTIAVSMILRVDQVHSFSDIGYYHQWLNQTSRGLPPPHADPFATVVCVYYDRWICSPANGTNSTNATFALAAPSWSKSAGGAQKQQHFFTRIGSVSPGSSLQLLDVVKGNQRGVLYTFAMRNREEEVANTLISLYSGFTKQFEYPIVIFYSASSEPRFDRSKVIDLVGKEIATAVRFVGVNTVQYYPKNQWKNISSYSCVETDREMYGIIKFLQFDAVLRLSYMGYEWFFRFDESSSFSKPVKYDIFQALALEGKRVGFLNTAKGQSPCWKGALETIHTLCYGIPEGPGVDHGRHGKKLQAEYQCANTLDQWPQYVSMFGGFLVSHISVWKTPICQRLRSIAESGDDSLGAQLWPISFVQTYCIVAGVPSHEIKKLDYTGYTYNWFTGKANNESLQSFAVISEFNQHKAVELTHVDNMFLPRRFGWLGGDCGYSVALPSAEELTDSSDVQLYNTSSIGASVKRARTYTKPKKFKKYLWLFADSLIGTSTPARYTV